MSIHLVINSDLRIKMLIISQFYKLIIAFDVYNPSLWVDCCRIFLSFFLTFVLSSNFVGSVSSMPDCLCPHHSTSESVLNVYKSHALSIMDNFQSKISRALTIWQWSHFTACKTKWNYFFHLLYAGLLSPCVIFTLLHLQTISPCVIFHLLYAGLLLPSVIFTL